MKSAESGALLMAFAMTRAVSYAVVLPRPSLQGIGFDTMAPTVTPVKIHSVFIECGSTTEELEFDWIVTPIQIRSDCRSVLKAGFSRSLGMLGF